MRFAIDAVRALATELIARIAEVCGYMDVFIVRGRVLDPNREPALLRIVRAGVFFDDTEQERLVSAPPRDYLQ